MITGATKGGQARNATSACRHPIAVTDTVASQTTASATQVTRAIFARSPPAGKAATPSMGSARSLASAGASQVGRGPTATSVRLILDASTGSVTNPGSVGVDLGSAGCSAIGLRLG